MPSVQPFPFGAFVVDAGFLGDTAVFALGDGTVRRVKGPAAETTEVHGGAILTAARSLDAKALVTGGDDGVVALTDASGGVTRVAEHPKKWVDAVAAGPGGAVAYATGKQAHVRLADGTTRTFDHERAAAALAFAPKGMRLGVARYGGISLWWPNTDAGAVMLDWKGSHIGITFSPDGRYVVTAMQENALHGWRLADGSGHLRMTGYPAKPKSLSWSAKGRFLASSGAEMAVLWPFHFKDGPQGKQPLQIAARSALTARVACHPSDEAVAIGYADGAVVVSRIADGESALVREPGDGPVSALGWDAAGLRLAFGTEQGMAGIIDIRDR